MLTVPNYKSGDVVVIKLSTGEEIITKLVEPDITAYSISRPLVFTMHPQTGQPVLIPWLMSLDPKDPKPIIINKSSVVGMTTPAKEITDHYLQSTTGIVAVPPGFTV
jgi:hypothetical protein|tara:strand:+ start:1885 stop:2205 length:321 start_codon:yes stop_codon:yes gene_type:complete